MELTLWGGHWGHIETIDNSARFDWHVKTIALRQTGYGFEQWPHCKTMTRIDAKTKPLVEC
jgi:hypothetical protein